MAQLTSPRRTAIALGATAVLLMMGAASPARAVPPVPKVPPVPTPDWYALCVTASPKVGHVPVVCIPDVTK